MHNQLQQWNTYVAEELHRLSPALARIGITLEGKQPHTAGERYLAQAVTTTSGRKLILIGRRTRDNARVIVKATTDPAGVQEIEAERAARNAMAHLPFSYDVFLSPKELHYERYGAGVISVQEFIEHECPFLARSLEEQFALVLAAFKRQEGAHATTYEHKQLARKAFSIRTLQDYLANLRTFVSEITTLLPDEQALAALLRKSLAFVEARSEDIARYEDFLTHTDFVPHNFRIKDGRMYLLDHSSIRFGNKYEGWARFTNFMTLHNPPLAEALVRYVRQNRSANERSAFDAMRAYRLTELLYFYTRTLAQSDGNLFLLNRARIHFWSEVLAATIEGREVSERVRQEYIAARDSLRSDEERVRQEGLH